MAAKIYTGMGPSISTESEFSVGNISRMLGDMASSKRADAQLLMQQAQHDYQMKTYKKLENSTNAINEWAGKGLDYGLLTSEPLKAFGKPLPSMMESYQGYSDAMKGYGISANQKTFADAATASQKQYMGQIVAQFNAVSAGLIAQPGVSTENVYRALRQNYNADTVYQNMLRAGMDTSLLLYDPTRVKQDLLPRIGRMLWEPPVEGIGGGAKLGTPAAVLAGAGAAKGAWDIRGGYKELLEKAQKDWGKMSAKDFKTEYDMTKTQAGGSPGKNKKFTSSKELKTLARSKGYGSVKVPGLKAGKSLLPYAAGGWAGAKGGAKITEMLGGGELAQAMGGTVGGVSGAAGTKLTMTKVSKKLADPEVIKRIMPMLKKVAPKLAAKIGLSVTGLVIPEVASSALGAAGLLWSAYDLVQLANQAPEIYAALAGD